jgi:YVTN family beta-propeller protein
MPTMNISLGRIAAGCGAGLLALLPAAGAAAGGSNASHPQQRQIAETTLTDFKVVLTATRVGTGLQATVTAAGYQNSAGSWKLIGRKRIGAAGQWFWYSSVVCGMTVTELKPLPSSAAPSDTLTVSLLMTPALGCSGNISQRWGPAQPATAYVVNYFASTVTPINTATNKTLAPIKVGRQPFGIAITPDGKTVYVNGFPGVTPISTATRKAGKVIKVPGEAYALAVTPDSKTVYVTDAGSDTVIAIATATNKPRKVIKVGQEPTYIAITKDGRMAYVANWISGTVTPIRLATSKTLTAIKAGATPAFIAITPNGKTAYVASAGSGTVTPINTATNKARQPIKVGNDPTAIAITPDGRTAYVATSSGVTPDPHRHQQGRQGHQCPKRCHRDHPGRQNALRLQRLLRHGDRDPDRHRQSAQGDQGRDRGPGAAAPHRDHPGRENRFTSPTTKAP